MLFFKKENVNILIKFYLYLSGILIAVRLRRQQLAKYGATLTRYEFVPCPGEKHLPDESFHLLNPLIQTMMYDIYIPVNLTGSVRRTMVSVRGKASLVIFRTLVRVLTANKIRVYGKWSVTVQRSNVIFRL